MRWFFIILLSIWTAHNSDDIDDLQKQETYCEGFEEGYEAGYCYEVYGCIAPVPPVCPIPEPGFGTYKDGYNRGFKTGLKDRD